MHGAIVEFGVDGRTLDMIILDRAQSRAECIETSLSFTDEPKQTVTTCLHFSFQSMQMRK